MTAEEIKEKIINETAKQRSCLIGNFIKPNTSVIIPIWAAVSVSDPEFLEFIGHEFARIIKGFGKVDLICGIATTGISLAAATSLESGIPWFFARGERKTYGSREAFDGNYYSGANVVFVDNLSAKGKGMIPVLSEAQKEGFKFSHLVCLADYSGWDKVDEFKQHNIKITSLISVDELVDGLNKINYFPGSIYHYIKQFLQNPSEWLPESKIVKDFMEELKQNRDNPVIKIFD